MVLTTISRAQGEKPPKKGATAPGVMSEFPWEPMGNYKYVLFLPFAYLAATGQDDADRWCYHMCVIAALRYLQAYIWHFLSRNHHISGRTRIQEKGIDFNQIDREDNWDDYIILQAYVSTAVHMLPYLYCQNLPCQAYLPSVCILVSDGALCSRTMRVCLCAVHGCARGCCLENMRDAYAKFPVAIARVRHHVHRTCYTRYTSRTTCTRRAMYAHTNCVHRYCSKGVCHAFSNFPLYDGKGLIKMLLIHMGPTEFIYYWLHRALHWHSLYAKYHSHHHASFVPEAITGSVHPFMEHLMYTGFFPSLLLFFWFACRACILLPMRVGVEGLGEGCRVFVAWRVCGVVYGWCVSV